MIIEKEGKNKSVLTDEEFLKIFNEDLEALSPEDRIVLQHIIDEIEEKESEEEPKDGLSLVGIMSEFDYEYPRVGMREWLENEYYFGDIGKEIWPQLKEDLITLFEGDYQEVIFGGGIGWGKCVRKDTEIYDVLAGRRILIGDCKEEPVVQGINHNNGLSEIRKASFVGRTGVKKVCVLKLSSGKKIGISLDHPLLTKDGWKEVRLLKAGDLIATPRRVPPPINPLIISNSEVKFVAYMLSKKCGVSGTFTNTNAEILREFKKVSLDICDVLKIKPSEFSKRVPAEFYGLSDPQLALFLNRIFACEGNIYSEDLAKIEICLLSEKFIDDIQFLLLRFGIHSRKIKFKKFYKKIGGKKKCFDAWMLSITGGDEVVTFLKNIGYIFGKEKQCDEILSKVLLVKGNTNVDIAPIGKGFCCNVGVDNKWEWICSEDIFWDEVESIREEGFEDVYDLTVPEIESFVANGIYCHNTLLASVGMCRMIYEVSCLRNPQNYYGLATDSRISFVNVSISQKLAKEVIFESIVNKLERSPYFKERFPFSATQSEVRFPKNVWIAPASSQDTNVLGLNIFGGIIDETNFMPAISQQQRAVNFRWRHFDKAELLYGSILRRIKSRFMKGGRIPGKLFLISSKKGTTDFTERRIQEAKTNPHVFVREYAVWDVAPPGTYSEEKFWVVVGNQQIGPKMFTRQEEVAQFVDQEDVKVVGVPIDFLREFELDLEGSIRETAGIATHTISLFLPRRDKIEAMFDRERKHPFSREEWSTNYPLQFDWASMVKRNQMGEICPIINPSATRHIHMDLSRKNDATGFCMAHIGGLVDVIRGTGPNSKIEKKPLIIIDFVLRIVPPPGDEIYLPEVRTLIYELAEHGYRIGMVTMDRFGSDECVQQLKAKGYRAFVSSVDINPVPYEDLKNAINDERIKCYYYAPLEYELLNLIKGRETGKVDHPDGGCKDVADAVAGVVYSLENKKVFMARQVLPPPMIGISEPFEDEDESVKVNSGINRAVILPPMLGGPDPKTYNGPRYTRYKEGITKDLGDTYLPFVGGRIHEED